MGMLAQALSGAAGGFAQGYGEALKMDMQSQASQRLEAARQAHDEHMAELRNTQDNARLDKTQAFDREQNAAKEAGQGSGNFDPVTGREYSKLQWGSVRDTEEGKKAVGSGMLQKPMTPEQQAEHEARMAGYSNSAAMISKQTKELDAEIKDKAASKEAIAKASEDLNSAIDSGDQQEINKAQAKMSIALKQVPKMGVERDTAATNMQINAIKEAAELAGKDKYEDANDVLSKAGMSPAYEQKISPITGEPLLDEAGNAQWSRRSPSPQAGGGGYSPAFPGAKAKRKGEPAGNADVESTRRPSIEKMITDNGGIGSIVGLVESGDIKPEMARKYVEKLPLPDAKKEALIKSFGGYPKVGQPQGGAIAVPPDFPVHL